MYTRAYIMLSMSAILAPATISLAIVAEQSKDRDVPLVPKGYEERQICSSLSNTMIRWLTDGDVVAGAKCDTLCDALLKLDSLSVKGHFTAAQTANLRGKLGQAAAILVQLIEEHPDEPAQVMNFPVKIVAGFWLASVKRRSGDLAGAKTLYEEILLSLNDIQGREGLTTVISLYLAEMDSEKPKDKEDTVARLRACDKMLEPSGQWGVQYRFYRAWAKYIRTKVQQNAVQADDELFLRSTEFMAASSLAAVQLRLVGITDVPLSDYSSDARVSIIGRTLLGHATNAEYGSMNADLAVLVCAMDSEGRGNTNDAIEQYSRLSETTSFLSPVASLHTARLKAAAGDKTSATDALQQVRMRYPQLNSLTGELAKRWRLDKSVK